MAAFRKLLVIEACSIGALLFVSSLMAVGGVFDSVLRTNSLVRPADSALIGFVYTAVFGFLPVVLIGAPGYLVLLRYNFARLKYVLLLGITPGVFAVFFHPSLGLWAIVCGALMASITHFIYRKLGPNNSSKPMPLRGTA